FADIVADRCAQIRRFRQSGDIPEPLWHACAGVLARCIDGEERWHQWSANGFDGYDAGEAAAKFARAGGTTGATTCEHFAGIEPAGCAQCPLRGRITSPVFVPGASPLPTAGRASGTRERTPFGTAQGATSQPVVGGVELPDLKPPFCWLDGGK